ncbi:outer membrane beta-barrel protein [Tabrizicola sp.]|uniref:outer membrane beta-barrel protein n=1 Tax=Tabrizicola sp. TaxID=2005166 RepID=UPI002FDE08DF
MRRSGLALGGFCAVSAALCSSAALAQDGGVRMVFGLENRLEISRNTDLSVPATGTEVTDVTRLSFGLFSETQIDRLEFSASGALIAENAAGGGGTEFDFGRGAAELAYHREVPAAVFDLGGYYRSDDIDAFDDAFDDFDETGTRTDFGANVGLELGRTSAIGFAIGVAYDATDYQDASDPDLHDVEGTRADAAVILHASETVTGRLGLRYSLREEEDPAATRTEALTSYAGLDYAISDRLALAAEIGYSEVETEEFGVTDRTTGPDLRLGLTYDMPVGTALALFRVTTDDDEGQRETFEIGRDLETPTNTISARLGITHADEAGTDLIGRLAIDRRLPDGSLGLRLERSVVFDDDDDESEVVSLASISWTKNVNEISSISLGITYQLSDAPSERIEQVSFGAGYSRELTADWTLNSGVGYRVRNDADGHAESPTLFVSLSREFEFRP